MRPLGRQELREEINLRKSRKNGEKYKRTNCGRTGRNEGGFIPVETSMVDDGCTFPLQLTWVSSNDQHT